MDGINEVKSLNLYAEYVELASILSEEEQKDFYYKIIQFVFYDIEPSEFISKQEEVIWKNLIRPIKISKQNSLNGVKGGRPQKSEIENEKESTSKMSMSMSNDKCNLSSIINNYFPNKIFNAKELQLDFNNYLQENGFHTMLEVKVDSNGSRDYKGLIDIVAEYDGKKIAIELDNVSPQGKSIYKLKNYQCDYRFILLRNNHRHFFIEDIEVIGLQQNNEEIITKPYKQIIDHLNKIAGTHYKYTSKKTQDKIKARLNEGFTLDDFIVVIDKKFWEWKGTDFEQYMRPETLFGNKFESYLNQPAKKITTKDIKLDDDFYRDVQKAMNKARGK